MLLLAFIFIYLFGFVMTVRGMYLSTIMSSKAKSVVCILLAEKLPIISYDALQQENNSGKILNIVGTDIELFELLYMSHYIWTLPVYIIVAVGILWYYIGYAGIVGVGIIVAHLIIIIFLGKVVMTIRLKIGKITDSRVKMITNLIEGIKLVKLYTWEKPYLTMIKNERNKEIFQYTKLAWLQIMFRVINFGLFGVSIFIPIMIVITINGEISIKDAFSSMTVLFLVSTLLTYVLTIGIRNLYMFFATCQRITQILLLKEIDEDRFYKNKSTGITMKKASFSWSEPSKILETHMDNKDPVLCLSDLSFYVAVGELLMVTGPVGCGKSSLLMSILREIYLVHGDLQSNPSIAYVSAHPWVISDSIKENIVMGRTFEEDLYEFVLNASVLCTDLEQLEHGDETIVGDKGITLSGGQKARIGLARALYANKDILLLDDPLSAVDTEVSGIIFDNIRQLVRDGKTVLLVTHQVQYLSGADKILILKNGSQVFFGSYQEMTSNRKIKKILGKIAPKSQETHEIDRIGHNTYQGVKESAKQEFEEEEKAKGRVPFKFYYIYTKLGFKSIFVLLLFLLIMLISQAALLSIYYWINVWSSADDQKDSFYYYGAVIIIFALYIFGLIRFYSIYTILIAANKELHNQSIDSLVKTDSVFFDRNPSGRILNRYTKDTIISDINLLTFFAELVNISFFLLGNIILILIISPGALFGVLLYAIVIYYIIKFLLPVNSQFRKLEIISRGPLLTSINAVITGLVTIRSLGVYEKFSKITREAAVDNMRALVCVHSTTRYLQILAEIGAFSIGITSVIFLIALKGYMDPGLAGVTLSLIVGMNGFSAFWSKSLVETDNYMASPERLYQYLKLVPEGAFKTGSAFKIAEGKIEFRDVHMSYQPHLPYSLEGVTFEIQPNTKVGIIGRTGAGKSSILNVLFRLSNPSSGTIYIDGQDYLAAGLHQLRKQMSVIPQTSLIFKASIRKNIDPFNKSTDDSILNVLRKVKLLSFVEHQEKGLDSELVSDQLNLSSGQQQLLCLARAILSDRKIVMMDEATANVDHKADELIQKRIRRSFKQSTLLIIAHRLRTIINSNVIIVMDKGKCKEIGAPQVLIQSEDSLFTRMITHAGPEEARYLRRALSKGNA